MIPISNAENSLIFYLKNKEYFIKFENNNEKIKINKRNNYVIFKNAFKDVNIKYENDINNIKETITILNRDAEHKLIFKTNFDNSININTNYIITDNKGEIYKNKVSLLVNSNKKRICFNISKFSKDSYPINIISQ